ncbi:MAG: hypothetical protein Ta2F_00760 [Termitinemataceae bacterium]|nr:MAG: hypothetical protein Ta2F_00760 [Termitinemataceae bacterium]
MPFKSEYQKKLVVLSSICAALVAIYMLSFVFSSEKSAERSALWTIVSEKLTKTVENIEISGNDDESISLFKENDHWFVSYNEFMLPARLEKIEELLKDISLPAAFPIRSSSGSDSMKFGLGSSAKKIILRTADGSEVLELQIGNLDNAGKNIYVARKGEKEVRLGKDIFSAYLNGARTSWQDMRFFPANIDLKSVQRVIVYQKLSGEDETQKEDWTMVRDGSGWKFEEGGEKADKTKADTFVQSILDSSGEDFLTSLRITDAVFAVEGKVPSRIVLETGDGKSYKITLGPKAANYDGNERLSAAVTDRPFVFTLADWTVNRLWKDKNDLL